MTYIILLVLINVLVIPVATEQLFAGNGLTTYAYNVYNGETLEMNCTTYNDCYWLLCGYLFQPMYVVTVNPNYWNGSCVELNKDDNRTLEAEFYVYNNNDPIGSNSTLTVSDASILLCALNNNKLVTKIYFFPNNCSLSVL